MGDWCLELIKDCGSSLCLMSPSSHPHSSVMQDWAFHWGRVNGSLIHWQAVAQAVSPACVWACPALCWDRQHTRPGPLSSVRENGSQEEVKKTLLRSSSCMLSSKMQSFPVVVTDSSSRKDRVLSWGCWVCSSCQGQERECGRWDAEQVSSSMLSRKLRAELAWDPAPRRGSGPVNL